MAADTPFRTYIPLPGNPASGNDKSSEDILTEVPIHIITDPSQLPPFILCPPSDKEQVVGFDCEGVDLSRDGVLCIMQIASQDAVYIIDAFQGGDKLMQACKPVLESESVIKVIHDCKRDSEALYHQFGIKLHNVMDTQIAYNLFEEQEGRPRSEIEYISFVDLLADHRYCGISYAEKKKVRGLLKEDPMFWTYRPFTEEMVFAAADDVRFLPYIYHKIMEKLNQKSLWQLAVRGSLYCRCFCDSQGYADWPPVPAPPDGLVVDGKAPEAEVLSVLDVPPGKMGSIIGRKGVEIQSIKESCNAEFLFGGSKGPLDKVFIIGPKAQVMKAEALLRGRMMYNSMIG